MNIIESLTEKPWLAQDGDIAEPQTTLVPPERIALRFFLGAVSLLFFLFLITFLSRSQFPDFIALSGQPWQPFTDASQLWVNTSLLLLASLSIQWGMITTKKNQLNSSIVAVFLTLIISISFLFSQYSVWQQLMALGYYVDSNPANSFFYLLTAIHGLHLIGGIVVLLRAAIHFYQSNSLTSLNASLSLCATYWHFLFIVWLVLFALLTSSSETYSAIAALCGF